MATRVAALFNNKNNPHRKNLKTNCWESTFIMFNKPKWRQRSDTFNSQQICRLQDTDTDIAIERHKYTCVYLYTYPCTYVYLMYVKCFLVFMALGMQLIVVTTNWLC